MTHNLKELLQDCINVGYLTNDFAIVAIDLAKTRLNSRQDIPEAAREEALGRFTEKLVRKWESIDPEKNIKSYINSMAYTSLMDELRKYQKNHAPDLERLKENQNVTMNKELILFSNILKEAGIKNGKTLSPYQRKVLKKEARRLFDLDISDYRIAKIFGLSRMTVGRWRKSYEKQGIKFLDGKPRGGDRRSNSV